MRASVGPALDLPRLLYRDAATERHVDGTCQDARNKGVSVGNEPHVDHVHPRPAQEVLVERVQPHVAARFPIADRERTGPNEVRRPVGEDLPVGLVLAVLGFEDVTGKRRHEL